MGRAAVAVGVFWLCTCFRGLEGTHSKDHIAPGVALDLKLAATDQTACYVTPRDLQPSQSALNLVGIGDINQDGRDDFVISPLWESLSASYLQVSFGSSPPQPKEGGFLFRHRSHKQTFPGFQIHSAASGWVGISVTERLGDINGDSIDDVAFSDGRRVYIIYGRPASDSFPATIELDANATSIPGIDVIIDSHPALYKVAASGDINGDGLRDLVLSGSSNRHMDPADDDRGNVLLLYGSRELPGHISPGQASSPLIGITQGDPSAGCGGFGAVAGGVGDVDQDGLDDFVVGSMAAPACPAYLIYGDAAAPVACCSPQPGLSRHSQLNWGAAAAQKSKYPPAVSSLMDVNGDGLADFALRGPLGHASGGARTDDMYVIFGRAGGFAAEVSLPEFLNGTNGFVLSNGEGGDGPDSQPGSLIFGQRAAAIPTDWLADTAPNRSMEGVPYHHYHPPTLVSTLLMAAYPVDGSTSGAVFVMQYSDSLYRNRTVDLPATCIGNTAEPCLLPGMKLLSSERADALVGASVSGQLGDIDGDGRSDVGICTAASCYLLYGGKYGWYIPAPIPRSATRKKRTISLVLALVAGTGSLLLALGTLFVVVKGVWIMQARNRQKQLEESLLGVDVLPTNEAQSDGFSPQHNC